MSVSGVQEVVNNTLGVLLLGGIVNAAYVPSLNYGLLS